MLDIPHGMLDIPKQNPLKYGFSGIEIHFYPNAWADQRIQQEFKSVIAGWITSYPPCG